MLPQDATAMRNVCSGFGGALDKTTNTSMKREEGMEGMGYTEDEVYWTSSRKRKGAYSGIRNIPDGPVYHNQRGLVSAYKDWPGDPSYSSGKWVPSSRRKASAVAVSTAQRISIHPTNDR